MQAITHDFPHQYQPTSSTCGYTSLSMLMAHYGLETPVSQLLADVPQGTDDTGEPIGSITAQLATWCAQQGFAVEFWSFDFLITDLSWRGLPQKDLTEKLESIKEVRDIVQVGGKEWSKIYIQAYLDLIAAGGILHIEPHVTTSLLYERLQAGPVYVNVCSAVMNARGRARYPDPDTRTTIPDDIHGIVGTHSIVVYGNDNDGNFFVADPWEGLNTIDSETMLCAITAANLECDSQIFQVTKVVTSPHQYMSR